MKLLVVAVQILYISGEIFARNESYLIIPKGFSIGAATAAYQIEGAWNVSDKSESIWDRWSHSNASYLGSRENGDIAADSYHKYKEDVQLVKNIGLDHYRFSISWSRVLPKGTPDIISKDGMQYYKNLIDEVLDNGIVPFVTMHHFDDVQSLIDKTGGWTNEMMIEYFADYARVLFRELGPKVKFWSTINELDIYCDFFFSRNETTPNIAYRARYSCVHNLLKAHARAYHIYNEEFRAAQGGQVGLIGHGGAYFPISPDDRESAQIGINFDTGWIMHPIFSKQGDYPDIMKRRIAENSRAEGLASSRLPEFSPEWVEYIKGSADYLGFNHYIAYMVEPAPKIQGRWFDDSGLNKTRNSAWEYTRSDFPIVPAGMGLILRQLRDNFGNPPVYILESGFAGDERLNDTGRISYLYSYLREVLLAVRDGCDVRSYTVWSLLDNFEWFTGYSHHFGIVHVDFNSPNRTRTPRLSSYWLKEVMDKRILLPFNEAWTFSDSREDSQLSAGNASSDKLHKKITVILGLVLIFNSFWIC